MKAQHYAAMVIIFLAVTGIAGASLAAYPQTMTTASTWVNLPRPADDPRWATAFSHWDKRKDTDEVEAALAIIEEIARDQPDNFECQLWICRMNYFMAMRKLRKRDEHCKRSIEAGARALEIKPDDDSAILWGYSSILLVRNYTEAELDKISVLALKVRQFRILAVRDDDPLWAEAIKKFDAREDRDQALAAIEVFKKIDAKHPEQIEAKIFLARTYYWLGLSGEGMMEKANWHLTGSEWARKAMDIEPRCPSANYLLSASLGSYADLMGPAIMLRHSIEITKALIVTVEEDPTFMYCGFSRFLASALAVAGELSFKIAAMLGFPEDLIIRVTTFGSVLEPACLENHLSPALMFISLGRKDEAKAALETVINADPAVLKYYEPENRVAQKEAQELYDRLFK